MEGPVTGPILLILGLTAFYPAWEPIVAFGLSKIAADIGSAWKNGIVNSPDITPQGGVPSNSGASDNTVLGYGIGVRAPDGTILDNPRRWWPKQSDRDAAWDLIQTIPGLGLSEGWFPGWPLSGDLPVKIIALAEGGGTLVQAQ